MHIPQTKNYRSARTNDCMKTRKQNAPDADESGLARKGLKNKHRHVQNYIYSNLFIIIDCMDMRR